MFAYPMRKNMEKVLLLLAIIPICVSDVKIRNQTNIVRSTVKSGNNKRWMPAISQLMPHDVDNNMGFFDNGFGGGQVGQTQEPIGSITANYNNQDQMGGVPQESMSYNDPGAAMTNEIGLPETMGDNNGVQQELGREGFQQNIGNEVSAFMKQEPNNLDSPENFAQLEGLGDSFSSKLAESDLLGTNLQTINNALLPKASAFIGSKLPGAQSSSAQTKLPLPPSTGILPASSSAAAAAAQLTAATAVAAAKETPAATEAATTLAPSKPTFHTPPKTVSTPEVVAKNEPTPAPAKPVSPPSESTKVAEKAPEKDTKEAPAATDQPAADTKPAAAVAPAKPKEAEETKKVEEKKEEPKPNTVQPPHAQISAETTPKVSVSNKGEDSENENEVTSKHLKEESHTKKKHKVHITGNRRHSPVKPAEVTESGDGEDDGEGDDTSDSADVNSAQKASKSASEETERNEKQEQDQRIQKLKERIRVQKTHKHKFKPVTGAERQVITAKLGGVEDTESEHAAATEENREYENLNLNNNIVSPSQLSAIESQLRTQGTNPGLPSASIKQQLVSSLKQALLANVAAMIKNKAKSIGNPVEAPLQNIANQFYAKSSKSTENDDEEGSNESVDQGKAALEQQQQQNQESSAQSANEANEDQKAGSGSAGADLLEQDLMKIDKKKLVHVLANLMKSQKSQGGMQFAQLFGQTMAKPGAVVQNFMKPKTENAQAESQPQSQSQSQDDQQGDSNDDQDDDDDGQDDSQPQSQQQSSQADKSKESKQSAHAGQQQQLSQQQQQALMQQIKLEQQRQQQQQDQGNSQEDKDQKDGDNVQEPVQDGKQAAKLTNNQHGVMGDDARGDQSDQDQDDDQGDQGQDDGKGQQGNEGQDANPSQQSQQSQAKLANELLQRIHNKVGDMNKDNQDNQKESADEDSEDDDKGRPSQKPTEETNKKLKHGSKSRHLNQKQQGDPYAQIGLEDPSNNDKLSHKTKAQSEEKETDAEKGSQEREDSGKERAGAKAQNPSALGKDQGSDQGDDGDSDDSQAQVQAPKGSGSQTSGKEVSASSNTQLQQQALQQQVLQQQALQLQQQQQQQQQLHQADLQQLVLSHGGKHHSGRHIVNIQKFIGSQGGSLTGRLLNKVRTGLSRSDLKNQVEDIYATIGSFDPNVRKKKHKISKVNN